MARQHPRKKKAEWIAAPHLPQEYQDQGLQAWVRQHEQANPFCWACGAPGQQTILVESNQLNPLGGNVTCYTLCQECTQNPQVRQRIQADVEQDEAHAARIRSN
jgi:hypothetical protein